MFRSILVPVDLAQRASAAGALAIAGRLAAAWRATLALVTVLPSTEDDPVAEAERGRSALAAVARDALAAAGLAAMVEHARFLARIGGSISGGILAAVEALGADLVVMPSHDPRITDYLIGSNAAHVAVHAPASVLIVRGAAGKAGFRSVLVPVNLDLPSSAERAMAVAREIARRDGAELTVLSVQPVTVDEEGGSPPDYRPRLAAFVAAHGGREGARMLLRLGGSVSAEIRDAAEEIGADLIVMGARAPHFAGSMVGSTAAHVALHAPVSVLVVR